MTPLEAEIRALIAAEGPIGIDRYMALALAHPVHGYYVTRDPLGAAGDFTTAPEISQMFGELLGLWAATVWTQMGRPPGLNLVELGPGRGTLMADALRAAASVPGFLASLRVHLVEASPVLRERQRAALREAAVPIKWHAALSAVPSGPAIVLANEFLDALPVRQFVRGPDGWHERLVGLDGLGGLVFGLAPAPDRQLAPAGRPGDILEIGSAGRGVVAELSGRLVADCGAALLVDYGHLRSGFGDTLQAMSRHAHADPLEQPGGRDLTAHVDFAALARAAEAAGATVHGPIPQGDFLAALGIRERAARLSARADPTGREAVRAALDRLTDPGPTGMGSLFKVLGLSGPGLDHLPGVPGPGWVAADPAPARPEETRC